MIVRPYDETAPEPPAPPDPPGPAPAPEGSVLVFTPFRTVKLGHSQELRIDIAEKGDSVSVSCRLWQSRGKGRPMRPEHPMHIFPEFLPDLVAALTAAGAALGVPESTHDLA